MCITPAPMPRAEQLNRKNQGSNWCSQPKRLAIYMRDGLACCYCGVGIESGVMLSLDHVLPSSLGGTNDESNLITCCSTCNSRRGNREYRDFAIQVAGYVNVDADVIIERIDTLRFLPLDRKGAKAMIERRGSCAKVLSADFIK